MNINQLESYNLADAVKFHDNLNPLLWDRRENLHPEIHDQLMAIAADFGEFLGVKDLDLTDITISGSNAAYSYTPHSDIDLHLVVDLSGVEHEDVYRELFTAKKAIYNKENTITIKGIPVEVYVQDATQEHHSQGIYSILNSNWIQIPRRVHADIDDVSVKSKYQDLSKRIKNVIKTNDLAQMNELMDKIRQMRSTGLSEKGEFGPENLAFKILRNKGDIKKLNTARQAAKNQELSLKERVRTSAKYGYGKDYIEEVGLTPDGTNPTTSEFTNESQLDEVGLTPDGTNPTTAQFANETKGDHKSTIKDFMEFCADQLGIDKDISLRIRRDPQWSVRNKTFGRYNDGTNELEVGIGGRHIMDILRTVAHELVHQKQNQHAAVPANAGEDGSKYENEANARAGVLMRQYGKLHPELFTGSVETTTETFDKDNKNGTAPLGPESPPEFPAGTVKVDVSDVYDWYKLGQNISNLDHIDPDTMGKGPPQTILAFGNEPEEHKYMKQLKKLGLKTHDIDPPWYHDVDESNDMESMAEEAHGTRLKDLATVATNMPDADFWLIRKGSDKTVGTPVKEFEPSRIGVKIVRTDVLDPNYLYYAMMHLHNQGYFARLAVGTLKLVNIKVSDVANISFGGQGILEDDNSDTERRDKLKSLLRAGKDRGYIFQKEITTAFPEITTDDIASLSDQFGKMGIVVYTHEPDDNDSKPAPTQTKISGSISTSTPEFKKWFSGSKVVDADGNPLRVYHAAPKGFEGSEFKPPKVMANNGGNNPSGYYFSPRLDDANMYVKHHENTSSEYETGAQIIPAYLSIKNPYITGVTVAPDSMKQQYYKELVAFNGKDYADSKINFFKGKITPMERGYLQGSDAFKRIIEAGGFDGMLDGTHWVAFYPNQIKSVFNQKPSDSNNISTEGLNESAGANTVTRIDSKPIKDFGTGLQTYYHTPDWSQSGQFPAGEKIPKKFSGKVTGLYAGDPHFTALYATGNANQTRYVAKYSPGQPIVYLDRKDIPRIRKHRSYLSVFDASNFKKMPSGEYFSENPGNPIEQTEITDPFQYMRDQGWEWKIVDDLTAVLKKLKKEKAKYGAEGMGFAESRINESILNSAPQDIPQNIWNLYQKHERITAMANERIPSEPNAKGVYPRPQDLKREQTMSFRRLFNAVEKFTGDTSGDPSEPTMKMLTRLSELSREENEKDMAEGNGHEWTHYPLDDKTTTGWAKPVRGAPGGFKPSKIKWQDRVRWDRDDVQNWNNPKDVSEGLNEASGYIPTAAEAHDPRFEMALTVDVRPGALGKAANSFLLNTDSQGHPQELRPDGLVQRMTEELALFKKQTTKLTENKLKFSRDKLDSLLNDLCEKVMKGQEEAPDFYGMVAAAVIDPFGRLATGLNYLYGNQRIHAERDAIDNYEKEFGKLPRGCIVVTTLSPCNQDTGDVKEITCTEVLNSKHVKIAYCGYRDPTQHREDNNFKILITKNEKLEQMCKELADTFLKKQVKEKINIKEDITSSKAQQFIDNVYSQYPDWPYGQADKVMVWGEGENQQFAAFKLKPKPAIDDNTVEIDWIMAGPEKRQGVGSRAIKELQRQAQESGIKLTLYPWDKGIISQAALTRFYKRQGFKPIAKGAKPMRWEPTLDELKIDNVNGLGSTPNNQNIAYKGLNVLMKPSTFLKLALPLRLDPTEKKKIDYIKKELDNTGIGAPFLDIDIPEEWEKGVTDIPARVVGHDGRHRMMAIQSAEGDTPVEVHLFPKGYRNRDFKAHPEWVEELNSGLINESGQYMTGPFFQGEVNQRLKSKIWPENKDKGAGVYRVTNRDKGVTQEFAGNSLQGVIDKIQKRHPTKDVYTLEIEWLRELPTQQDKGPGDYRITNSPDREGGVISGDNLQDVRNQFQAINPTHDVDTYTIYKITPWKKGVSEEEDEDDVNEHLPSVNQAKNLIPMILPKVQKEYDDWDETNVDTYAGGGICHILADAICDVLGNNGIECTPVSSSHEQHVYVAGKFEEGIYIIDIPYHIYETGGGFSWKKIPNITFETGDVTFYRASSDPADWENYIDGY